MTEERSCEFDKSLADELIAVRQYFLNQIHTGASFEYSRDYVNNLLRAYAISRKPRPTSEVER